MFRSTLLSFFVLVLLCGTLADARRKQKSKKIINSGPVVPNSHPYHIEFLLPSGPDCGGALIHKNFVITAAHCDPTINYETTHAVSGVHDWTDKTNTQRREIKEFIKHPDYQTGQFGADIGLAYVEEPFKLDRYTQLIKVTTNSKYPTGKANITGMGLQVKNDFSTKSTYLKKTLVNIYTNDECYERYQGAMYFPRIAMCYSGKDDNSITCSHDSGGPVAQLKNGQFELVGVHNFGACDVQVTSGGTWLGFYIDWINDTIRDTLAKYNNNKKSLDDDESDESSESSESSEDY